MRGLHAATIVSLTVHLRPIAYSDVVAQWATTLNVFIHLTLPPGYSMMVSMRVPVCGVGSPKRHGMARLAGSCAWLALTLSAVFPSAGAAGDGRQVAAAIRQTFESDLFRFKPSVQRHWAERMFRLSGDSAYLYPIIFDAVLTAEALRRDVRHADDTVYLHARTEQLLERWNHRTRKGRLRRHYFGERRTELLSLHMLESWWRLQQYGLCDTVLGSLCRRADSVLRRLPFRDWLLDTGLIRIYSPQAVNAVYYLYQLGIADFRDAYRSRFREVFPDSLDTALDRRSFEDKLYGLTHFITAASRYYQQRVDSAESAWILTYFENRRERILRQVRADLVAEVALCFLLAGQENHSLVAECRSELIRRFDSSRGLIPSPRGNADRQRGEHRNILAYMVLSWSDEVYTGPRLPRYEAFRRAVPYLQVGSATR